MKTCKLIFLYLILLASSANALVVEAEDLTYESKTGTHMRNDVNIGDNTAIFDDSNPQESIANFKWQRGRIYKVRMWVGMATYIHLPANEVINNFTLGDDYSFRAQILDKTFNKTPNIIVVNSVNYDVHTNLNVLTESGKIFSLYLRSDPIESEYVPHSVVYFANPKPVQFDELPIDLSATEKTERDRILSISNLPKHEDYLDKLAEAEGVDTNYTMYGDADIAPYAVYSDDTGRTYFDYREGPAAGVLPALFQVIDGYDSIVHPRYVEGFLIADTISNSGWTLKRGGKTVCIRPNKPIKPKLKPLKDELIVKGEKR